MNAKVLRSCAVLATALVLIVATAPVAAAPGGHNAMAARNIEVVGHHDLDGRGFNADVWVHDGLAYVGQWGFGDWASGSKDRFCPSDSATSVAIVDVGDPASPELVGRLQNPAFTSVEDVVVFRALFGPMAGRDIAAGGIQWCGDDRFDPAARHGLMLWDVTNPALPVELALLDTGCCTRGLHEFEVQHRPDLGRTFAYATVPTSRVADDATASGFRDALGRGDFRLIDITNPDAPFEVSDWGVQDAGGPWYEGQGCDADANYGHGAEPSDDGRRVFLAYWDSGFIALDVTTPPNPTMLGRTVYPADADGDAHSSSYDDVRGLLFSADEDFCKTSGPGIEKGFGYLRVYDYGDPAAPVQVGEYRTPNTLGADAQAAGDYSLHNALVVGTDVYASWYSDGIRVLDAADPTALEEVGFFVPPSVNNPVKPSQRYVLPNAPEVWGVAHDPATNLIYASDMNSGLWILRRTD